MKFPIFRFIALVSALAGVAAADLPKKAPLSKYSGLWTNSPFTSKPPPPEAGPENNPLDDYALIGVSSIGPKNYRVTMINKKKPDEPRIYVDSDRESKGFKIVTVTRKPGDPLGTVVRMTSGSMSGTVAYDEKLLTLTAAQPARPAVQPGQPAAQVVPGAQPQQPNGQPQPQRQPRPRVVPPPAPVNGQAPAPQLQQGQAQPVPPNHANRNIQRPQRRGN